MNTFARKPKAPQRITSDKSTKPRRPFSSQSRDVRSILHPDTHTANHLKVEVDASTNRHEQEANRIADEALRQKKTEEDERVELKARASHRPDEREVNEENENRPSRSDGSGNPIPDEVRAFIEPRMRFDFGKVQIHTDSEAARMNQALGARAFTHGRDIYFGAGQYNPHTIEGKRLLAHELTHVVQQSGPKKRIQRSNGDTESAGEPSRREAILQNLESLRPTDPGTGSRFGSTEYALQTFQARISDLSDFIDVAESYGLQPGNLLAVFVLEGAWGREIYAQPLDLATSPPSRVRLNDEASVAAWHLWQTHGMDDYAVTNRVSGRGDNIFDVHSRSHRAAMLDSLGHLYAQGMLWNSEGLRPEDPRQQLTPADIVSQLTQHVNLGTQLPNEGFIRLAYRIQAATVASRQQLIGRRQQQLARLGYSPEIAEGFRHGEIERQRVRVAQEHQLFPATVHNQREMVLWTYRHLSDPEYGRALMEDDRYRTLVRRSFELRMPAEAARITMGTPEGARQAIADANADFQLWERQREGREAAYRWALDVNVYLIILRGGQTDEARTSEILDEIGDSLNEENFPNHRVRRAVEGVMRDWLRNRDYDDMQRLVRFVIDAGNSYSHIDTTRQWLAALAEPHGDTTSNPRVLTNYLLPTSRVFRGRIRNVLRIYGEAVRFARGLVEARRELD